MKRRTFIAALGGAAAWPVVAQAQQVDRVRRIAALLAFEENDPEVKGWLSGFMQQLTDAGWVEGRNLKMDILWAGANVDRIRMLAKTVVGLRPDVILANSTPVTAALHQETLSIPIVFVIVGDPVGDGFVASLPRPGGNITGFIPYESGMSGKWLELLTEIATGVRRVAATFNPDMSAGRGSYYLTSLEAAARSLKVELVVAPVHDDAEIGRVITSLGSQPRGGLFQMPDNFMQVHNEQIISLAARYNVPAIYIDRSYVRAGGLLSYGPDYRDMFRRAASYIDRILRGASPADLPVQLPVKFEVAVNTKTARALGLTVPQSILLRADGVIE
jgi:putative ABC transport system substrate-binding protein